MSSKIEVRRSKIHGSGVFAAKKIKKGEFIIEYRGKVRRHAEVDAEYDSEDENGHTFLFTLNDDYVIDANIDGNEARWINHSCDANCESSHEDASDGNPKHDRVVIKAARDIRTGEELSYNYGIRLAERHTAKQKRIWRCLCGSGKCTGTMLQPKRG